MREYQSLSHTRWDLGLRISRGVYTEATEEANFRNVVTAAWGHISRAGVVQAIEGGEGHLMEDHMHFWARFKQFFNRHRAARRPVNAPVDLDQVWGIPTPGSKWASVDLDHAKGVTRDLSSTGVYFETDFKFEKGSLIRFKINFDTPIQGNKSQLECIGHIVRIDARDKGKVGIAVKLDEQHLRTVTV